MGRGRTPAMTKLLALILVGTVVAGCASEQPCLSVKSTQAAELRPNPYDELPRQENPYKPATCVDLCLKKVSDCSSDCRDDACVVQCVEDNDCLADCQ